MRGPRIELKLPALWLSVYILSAPRSLKTRWHMPVISACKSLRLFKKGGGREDFKNLDFNKVNCHMFKVGDPEKSCVCWNYFYFQIWKLNIQYCKAFKQFCLPMDTILGWVYLHLLRWEKDLGDKTKMVLND